jgi:hypothetical protein
MDMGNGEMEQLAGHKFTHAISLGSQCYVSAVFKRLGLRRYSGPFDWMFTTVDMVQACIESDFDQFLDRQYYKPVEWEGKIYHKHTYHHTHWLANFTHYDPMSDEGHAYLERCVDRFRGVLDAPDPKLFLFVVQIHAPDRDKYIDKFVSLNAAITSRSDNATVIGVTVTPGKDAGMVETGAAGASRLFHYTALSPLGGITFQDPADDAMFDQMVTDLMVP